MAELKTQKNEQPVSAFLGAVEDETKRADSRMIVEMMKQATGSNPTMWGASIIGFGEYRYRYANGREANWMLVGFSPRKQNLTLYIMPGFEHYEDLLSRLGKYKTGKACLYIKTLEDVNMGVLKELIEKSVAHMKATNEVVG
jgi:hypothetical protein